MEVLKVLLDVVTISFYLAATIIAVLTYISAKKTLLNTVNTEYQKRVMDRLKEISDWLQNEFDPLSPDYWFKNRSIEDDIRAINSQFIENKEIVLEQGDFTFVYPIPKDHDRICSFLQRLKADPFVPNEIRQVIAEYLELRAEVIKKSYLEVVSIYTTSLKDGQYDDDLESNVSHINNEILYIRDNYGFGLEQVKNHVDEICLIIQKYLEAFNPIRSVKNRFNNIDIIKHNQEDHLISGIAAKIESRGENDPEQVIVLKD